MKAFFLGPYTAPMALVFGGGLVLLLWEAVLGARGRRFSPALAVLFLAAALVAACCGAWRTAGAPPSFLLQGTLFGDQLTLLFGAVGLSAALLAVLFSWAYLIRERAVTGEYYALLLLSAGGLWVLSSAAELITFFMGLELLSLTGYVLAGYLRVRERSVEAAWKYFLMGAFASAFLWFGVAMLYGASGSTFYFAARRALADPVTAVWAIGAGVFLLCGLAFKTALVPFHGWAPDAYDGAPAPVAAFLSTAVKAAAFAALARVVFEVYGATPAFNEVLAVLAALTMTVGNLGAFGQTSLKRLLAYSSVAHAGYAAMVFSVAGRVPAQELYSALGFYVAAYTLMTAGAFGFLSWFAGEKEQNVEISQLNGLGWKRPWWSAGLALFLFSLLGLPPTAGFFGKYLVFKATVEGGVFWLVWVAVFNSFLSAFYYLQPIVRLYLTPPQEVVFRLARPALGFGFALALSAFGTLFLVFINPF